MRRFLLVWLLVFAIALPAYSLPSGKTSRAKTSSVKKSSAKQKTVKVRGYYRKDGTYVRPHTRSAPGTASSSGATPYRPNYVAPGYRPHATVKVGRNGKIKRNKAARSAFMR
jgi:hypothetical protein